MSSYTCWCLICFTANDRICLCSRQRLILVSGSRWLWRVFVCLSLHKENKKVHYKDKYQVTMLLLHKSTKIVRIWIYILLPLTTLTFIIKKTMDNIWVKKIYSYSFLFLIVFWLVWRWMRMLDVMSWTSTSFLCNSIKINNNNNHFQVFSGISTSFLCNSIINNNINIHFQVYSGIST